MSLLDTLRAEESRLKAEHEVRASAYKAALRARGEADGAVRSSCDLASQTANELAAVRTSIAELEKRLPRAAVSGGGDLHAGAEVQP